MSEIRCPEVDHTRLHDVFSVEQNLLYEEVV